MQAEDVVTFSLVPDFLTSWGVGALTILDGITVRSTYALKNVAPNELEQDDAYLAPSGPLTLLTEWHDEGSTGHIYIESTINITETASDADAQTYEDPTSGEQVTVPLPKYLTGDTYTQYTLRDGNGQIGKTFKSVGSTLVDPERIYTDDLVSPPEVYNVGETISKGLARIRALGLEGAILNQYYLPTKYGEPDSNGGEIFVIVDGEVYDYHIGAMIGKATEETIGISLYQETSGTREGGVLNFSDFAKYGLMAASGESIEATPKDLMTVSTPTLRIIGDPRPEGRPYFRFKYINNLSTSNEEFFRNCVAGLEWKKLPLVFSQASGNALNTAKYQASRNSADVGLDLAQQSNAMAFRQQGQSYGQAIRFAKENKAYADTQNVVNLMSGMAQVGSAAISAGAGGEGISAGAGAGMLSSGGSSLVGAAMSQYSTDLAYQQARQSAMLSLHQGQEQTAQQATAIINNYEAAKLSENLAYGISQTVVTPTVLFPYNVETLRDFFGNGCLVYRYWYDTHDVARIKRILRAYGAKYSMQTVSTHFDIPSGEDYTYIEVRGLSVGGDIPQWQSQGIALQLANGVRIWDTRPHTIS